MRVVLEINSVLVNRFSGFFTYGAGLLKGFAALEERPELVFFCGRKVFSNAHWLPEVPCWSQAKWHVPPFKMRHLGIWWRWVQAPSLQRFTGPFDLYHCNHHLMPPTKGRPRLLTVHDLRRYRYREFYPESKLAPFENAVRQADHFIAISQATKTDIQEFFGIDDERIDVVYHGGLLNSGDTDPQIPQRDDEVLLQRFDLQPGRYFTVFSSYDKRKNLPKIIQAFLRATAGLPDDYRLVIIGQLPRREDIFPEESPSNMTDRIVFTGTVDDFMPLLRHCTCLVYASLYEGFGLPILEAISAGTAVITSNCSSMPEVAGDAALLVDPLSIEDMSEAMVKIASDEPLRKKLVDTGNKRVQNFSWTRAAAQTLSVYQKLI